MFFVSKYFLIYTLIFSSVYKCYGYAEDKPIKKINKKLISRTVGLVKDHVVTSREVQMNELLEKVLFTSKKKRSRKNKVLDIEEKKFRKRLTGVLIEWIVYIESKNFGRNSVSNSEMNFALNSAQKSLKNISAWLELNVSSRELKSVIRRKLLAKKFIQFKVKSSKSLISDDEAKAYYNDNREQFENLPFKMFKSNIKVFLEKKLIDQRIKTWFEVLQTKYNVQNYIQEK